MWPYHKVDTVDGKICISSYIPYYHNVQCRVLVHEVMQDWYHQQKDRNMVEARTVESGH